MTDSNYRHLVLIIDRSGSIAPILPDMQGGYEHFLKEQRAVPMKTTVSLWQFDDVHDEVVNFADIGDPRLSTYRIEPRRLTALLDAVGQAVTRTGETLGRLPEAERPGKVIVLIATDGQENASKEWTKARVRELVEQQRGDYGWEFIFNGADQDGFGEAGALGIGQGTTLNWNRTPQSTVASFAATSSMLARGAVSGVYSYSTQERKDVSQP